MEAGVSNKIERFLEVNSSCGCGCGSGDGDGHGYGYGDGHGSGYGHGPGFGYGCGFGCGYGPGSGSGSGNGNGSGSGNGSGVSSFCGRRVQDIDGVATIISAIFGNLAKGEILNNDLTTTPCYIAKRGNCFGHGETLAEAVQAAEEKLFDDMPVSDRIAAFWKHHEHGIKYPAADFFAWHHRLTGSCEMGRKTFAADHGVDLDNDTYTVEEFVELCKNSYGGMTIRKLLG